MEKVRIEEADNSVQPAAVMRPLTDALGATDLAINYYELEPGDSFAFAYHRHEIQEEVFYVQSGTATFRTEEGDVAVGPGEVVRFAPGEFQRGVNEGSERVVALALGAPLEYGDGERLRVCPDCESWTDQRIETAESGANGGEARVTICVDCGAETGRWTRGSAEEPEFEHGD